MKLETKFKLRVIRDLKMLPKTWFVKTQQVAVRGIPDFLICLNGLFIAIELKATPHSPISELQTWTLDHIKAASGMAYVAHPENWDSIFEQISSYLDT